MPGRLFVFSAPSGAGKSTIIDRLEKKIDAVAYSISHTSREPRGDEKDGVHYHFVDRDTFSKMAEAGEFVEWAEVHGNFYGTALKNLSEQTIKGFDVLLDIDSQGAKNIKRHFKNSTLIYVLPPSLKVLEARLRGRNTDDEKTVKLRLANAVKEIKNCKWYDHIIINDDLEKATEEAKAIILSIRCRTDNQAQKIKDLFGFSI